MFQNYFLDKAKLKNLIGKEQSLSDQPPKIIVQEIIKGVFLDLLRQELPYAITVTVEYIQYREDDNIHILSNVLCPSLRIARLIIGNAGLRVKKVAKEVEKILCMVFQTTVKIKISVPIKI